jgi:hypothetical protein
MGQDFCQAYADAFSHWGWSSVILMIGMIAASVSTVWYKFFKTEIKKVLPEEERIAKAYLRKRKMRLNKGYTHHKA